MLRFSRPVSVPRPQVDSLGISKSWQISSGSSLPALYNSYEIKLISELTVDDEKVEDTQVNFDVLIGKGCTSKAHGRNNIL